MRRIVASLLTLLAVAPPASAQPTITGAELRPVPYELLPGWREDDHAAAFAAFSKTCSAMLSGPGAARSAVPIPDGLLRACGRAAKLGPADAATARLFFEQAFDPFEVAPEGGRGFLTGYYEPELEASLERTEAYPVPALARPGDLVSSEDEAGAPLPAGLAAARRTEAGLVPYPDRAAIEDGALGDDARPVAFFRDRVDLFIAQVQGSARLRLPDGRAVRLAYAGKNGHPYTSVARLLVQKLGIPPAEMTADVLTRWLRDNPAEARDLMRQNRSYVFFRIAGELEPGQGPIGAAGVPVAAGRTLAVDRELWPYGVPVWLEGELPEPEAAAAAPLRRLVVAQDTGSAIRGPARGDLFFGSGEEAGRRAGLVRNPVRFVVLWPKPNQPTP